MGPGVSQIEIVRGAREIGGALWQRIGGREFSRGLAKRVLDGGWWNRNQSQHESPSEAIGADIEARAQQGSELAQI